MINQYLELDYPICVELSTDQYHDPIDPDIRHYFVRQNVNRYSRQHSYSGHSVDSAIIGTRDGADRNILAVGRGVNIVGARQGCAGEDMMVDATGFVYSCSCKHTRIGHVITDTSFVEWYSFDYAHQGGRDPHAEDEQELLAA